MNSEKPTIYVKRNKISEVFDYCMDNGISFSVQERAMGIDEYEVTLEIDNIKKAIQLGFFLRENRLELAGASPAEAKPVVRKPAARKTPEPVQNPLLSTPEVKTEVKPEVKPAPKVEAPAEVTAEPLIEPALTPVPEAGNESVSLSFDLN